MKDDQYNIGPTPVESRHQILEESGTAFDPSTQHMDLSKEEKRRTTALLMAIQAYSNLIIKDAEYLREVNNQSRSNEALKIRPATMEAMVDAAISFDRFIATGTKEAPEEGGRVPTADPGEA